MTGYFWVVVGFFVVAVTKYITSVRLRHLAEKVQKDHADASELRYKLVQAEEQEHQLKSETDRLHAKLTALRNVVGNLERSLQRHTGYSAPKPDGG
ncbi:MAG: hypothetical protein ABIL09_24430 [Gemmatimonadota bacterium]